MPLQSIKGCETWSSSGSSFTSKPCCLNIAVKKGKKYIANASQIGSRSIQPLQLSKTFEARDEPATFPRPSSYKFVTVVWGQSSKYDLNVAVSDPSVKKVMWVHDDLPWEATVSYNAVRQVSQCHASENSPKSLIWEGIRWTSQS